MFFMYEFVCMSVFWTYLQLCIYLCFCNVYMCVVVCICVSLCEFVCICVSICICVGTLEGACEAVARVMTAVKREQLSSSLQELTILSCLFQKYINFVLLTSKFTWPVGDQL